MSAPQQQLNRLATEKEKLTKELERTRSIIKVSEACEVCPSKTRTLSACCSANSRIRVLT